jgi:hypothetical protein
MNPVALSSAAARPSPYTRAEFARHRASIQRVEGREGLFLAAVSVLLGIAQILFLRWADLHLKHKLEISIAGPAFLAYLVLVGLLLWRYERKRHDAFPKCPQCGIALTDMSARIAVATGRCDSCGGQVLVD